MGLSTRELMTRDMQEFRRLLDSKTEEAMGLKGENLLYIRHRSELFFKYDSAKNGYLMVLGFSIHYLYHGL